MGYTSTSHGYSSNRQRGLTLASRAHAKIKTIEELGEIARSAQAKGRNVALCHGVFDLVHLGHIRHIQAARNEGDVVMVTVTADLYVNKGPGRPIFPENMRAEMLASLATLTGSGSIIPPVPSRSSIRCGPTSM